MFSLAYFISLLLSILPSTVGFIAPQSLTSFCSRHFIVSSSALFDVIQRIGDDFTIEQVSDRSRALDVFVFREYSVSADEYQKQQLEQYGKVVTEQEAIRQLTPTIDDNGRDTAILSGPMVTFIAVSTKREDVYQRTHGVVAAVDAILKGDHVYLRNLLVDERVRGCGLGRALVSAVKNCTKQSPVSKIILHVNRRNVNAVALYETEGFELQEERDGDGRMVLASDGEVD